MDNIDSYHGVCTQNDDNNAIPENTYWIKRCSACGLTVSYVPELRKSFLNHWEISLGFPIMILIVLAASYSIFIAEYLWYLPNSTTKTLIKITIPLVLFVISYIATILEGPGYLPFYYPRLPSPRSDSQPDYLSGVVTSQEQVDYVRSKRLPYRTEYFKTARRIVIRPDHFCDWTASFIGKRNHKLFFLLSFYAIFYVFQFLKNNLKAMVSIFRMKSFTPLMILSILFMLIGIFFFIFVLFITLQTFFDISSNQTDIEKMKKLMPVRRSVRENFEDVFGSIKHFYLWLLPIPAFCGMDDYLLVNNDNEI